MIVIPVMLKAEVTPFPCACVVVGREREGTHGKRCIMPSGLQIFGHDVPPLVDDERSSSPSLASISTLRMYLSGEMERSDEKVLKHFQAHKILRGAADGC